MHDETVLLAIIAVLGPIAGGYFGWLSARTQSKSSVESTEREANRLERAQLVADLRAELQRVATDRDYFRAAYMEAIGTAEHATQTAAKAVSLTSQQPKGPSS